MRSAYRRQDGIVIAPGTWLLLENNGVGKFSGTWVNPTLGLGYMLKHFRKIGTGAVVGTLYAFEHKETPGLIDSLEKAVLVTGPLRRGQKNLPVPMEIHTAQILPFEART